MTCNEDKSVHIPPCKEDLALRNVLSKEILFCFLWEFLKSANLTFGTKGWFLLLPLDERQGEKFCVLCGADSCYGSQLVVMRKKLSVTPALPSPPRGSIQALIERRALPGIGCATVLILLLTSRSFHHKFQVNSRSTRGAGWGGLTMGICGGRMRNPPKPSTPQLPRPSLSLSHSQCSHTLARWVSP